MSELTRYEIVIDPGPHEPLVDPSLDGEWVRAEEAEARIKELEAQVEMLTKETDGLDQMLQKADKLADAIERDQSYSDIEIDAALTAYREASK